MNLKGPTNAFWILPHCLDFQEECNHLINKGHLGTLSVGLEVQGKAVVQPHRENLAHCGELAKGGLPKEAATAAATIKGQKPL